jgi:hypothetical protein
MQTYFYSMSKYHHFMDALFGCVHYVDVSTLSLLRASVLLKTEVP